MYVRLRKYDAEMLLPSIPLAVTQEPERIDFYTKNSFRKYWANKHKMNYSLHQRNQKEPYPKSIDGTGIFK